MTPIIDAHASAKASHWLPGCARTAALLLLVVTAGAASAQTPSAPPVDASAPPGAAPATEEPAMSEAMKRSRRMAENPYRWIKMHAETKRKPDPVKPEPAKPEPARARPQPEPVIAERPRPRAPEAVSTPAAPEVTRPKAVAEVVAPAPAEVPAPIAAPAVATATPASAPASTAAPTEVATAAAPPDDANDNELVPISTPPPVFPRELRGTVATGRVTVAFTVQPDGAVGETNAESSTNRRLARAAIEAVKQWKFERMASAVTYKVEFDFKE